MLTDTQSATKSKGVGYTKERLGYVPSSAIEFAKPRVILLAAVKNSKRCRSSIMSYIAFSFTSQCSGTSLRYTTVSQRRCRPIMWDTAGRCLQEACCPGYSIWSKSSCVIGRLTHRAPSPPHAVMQTVVVPDDDAPGDDVRYPRGTPFVPSRPPVSCLQ